MLIRIFNAALLIGDQLAPLSAPLLQELPYFN
jgi:hypothetical protein